MTLDPQLEDRLRAALRRPENASWPTEDGAFDQFLRRRTHRGRALAARGALALVVVVALAAGVPRLLPGPRSSRRPRRSRAGRCRCLEAGSRSPCRSAGRT
jgi:hypothetical protein